jgi:hypothetical protein
MPVTADGNWATGEWDDSWIEYVSNGSVTDDRFCYKMDSSTGTYYMSWLFDFSDDTEDAGDIWLLCINGWPDADTTPDENCTKIEITGHTTLTVSQGDGSGWVEDASLADAVIWADNATTVHDVPFDYEHYCLEIQVNKGALGEWGANAPTNGNGFLVAMYDESNPSQGWVSWPPTDPDDPNTWGLIYTYMETIPEGFSLGLVALLSSIAVAAAFYSVRKTKIFPKRY